MNKSKSLNKFKTFLLSFSAGPKEANDALKASAKAKLVAGEPLTEAEADTLII